mmetsp:Transcript_16619/g.33721  ORF Transcript_16619/g.33721 Transcript_16619/m.33721 type:complete len:240 (+) Transcript_16619:136-855(+)
MAARSPAHFTDAGAVERASAPTNIGADARAICFEEITLDFWARRTTSSRSGIVGEQTGDRGVIHGGEGSDQASAGNPVAPRVAVIDALESNPQTDPYCPDARAEGSADRLALQEWIRSRIGCFDCPAELVVGDEECDTDETDTLWDELDELDVFDSESDAEDDEEGRACFRRFVDELQSANAPAKWRRAQMDLAPSRAPSSSTAARPPRSAYGSSTTSGMTSCLAGPPGRALRRRSSTV